MSENDPSSRRLTDRARDLHDFLDLRAERNPPCENVIHITPFRIAYIVGCNGFARHMVTQYGSKQKMKLDHSGPTPYDYVDVGEISYRTGYHARFFPQLPNGGVHCRFAPLHMSTGKAPQPCIRLVPTPHQKHFVIA